MKTDVIIVGAGPTGLALACQLIRYGIDFIIIDKKERTTPFSRAIGVQARTLEIYEQMGLARDLIALGKRAEMVRLIEGGAVRGEVILKDIGKGMSPYPFLLVVEQSKHESLLYQFICSNGRDVRWRTEMTGFSRFGDGVRVELRGKSGEALSIDAKYLVGCDGARSLVRHSLGLTFEGETVERLFYVADVEIDWKYSHDSLHICLAEHTITAFFPMVGENRYRIVGTFPEGHEGEEGKVLYEEIERQIEADAEMILDIVKVNWFSTYKVHSRSVNKFSEGRCFVAGDAAHIHTPAGGQGMNTGIQDGYNLAWKLALALNGNAASKLLETYNEERLPNAHRLLATTDRLFQFGASDEWFISFVRTQIFPYVAGFALSLDIVKSAIFPLVSQIGINYRESSLSHGQSGFSVRAGDRMPYFKLDQRSIYDLLREPKFHLIAFGASIDFDTAEFSELLEICELSLSHVAKRQFGTEEPFFVLLRPDNYIAAISKDLTDRSIRQYFDELI